MQRETSHHRWLHAKLADLEFAAEYLNAASEDEDPKVHLAALRHARDAIGAMSEVQTKSTEPPHG